MPSRVKWGKIVKSIRTLKTGYNIESVILLIIIIIFVVIIIGHVSRFTFIHVLLRGCFILLICQIVPTVLLSRNGVFFVQSCKLLALRRIESFRDRKLRGMGATGKKTIQTLINAQLFTDRFQYPIIFWVVNREETCDFTLRHHTFLYIF